MILGLLLACVGVSEPSAPTGAVTFPHPEDYDTAAAHGADALASGVQVCVTCHREGTRAPPCATCHDNYPHAPGWLSGATHGAGLTGDTGAAAREVCAKCHGVEGAAAPACTTCHASWPHPEGWETGGQHGLYALARGSATVVCGSCHGADLAGTDTAPGCTTCHTNYPHSDTWADPKVHGTADLTTCWACHGDLGTGGTVEVACARCHSVYPHVADWATSHMATVERVGQAVCLDCHDPDKGPALPVACGSSCHGGLP